MDPLAAADRLLAAIQDDQPLGPLVVETAVAQARVMEERRAAWAGHRLQVLDRVMKRNLLFVSYAWLDPDGREGATGTWIWSFDRDGRLIAWSDA